MKTFAEWVAGSPRTAGSFIKEFKNQQVQVHILQALMGHEHYRGRSAVEILELEIPLQLEKDVQEYLGVHPDRLVSKTYILSKTTQDAGDIKAGLMVAVSDAGNGLWEVESLSSPDDITLFPKSVLPEFVRAVKMKNELVTASSVSELKSKLDR